ncbi:hypothetical protein ACFCVO_16360 [Agromyces sp. NPDC056379]|uniref:hypothetical protein n=1 Tax=unclassified Agromyces TaxID=2639701 RepID=UPI0035D65716
MESIAARAALNLDPAITLTPESIDAAYRTAAWARHPSRYPDAESRHAAELWATTLQQARATLLAESSVSEPADPGSPAPRRGLSKGWIAGIVAGASVVVIGLIVGLVFGVTALTERFTELAKQQPEGEWEPAEFIPSNELMFTFPASIEWYSDGRHLDQCPTDAINGCWDVAVIPEDDCDAMLVELGFTGTPADPVSTYEEREFNDARAGEPSIVVFWNNAAESAWISDVRCLDAEE